MGAAKRRNLTEFSQSLITSWEDDDCINFAIALARKTGWLLHVDWWAKNNDPDTSINEMIPLRIYVGDNADNIFDVRGIKKIEKFNDSIIMRICAKRGKGKGGVKTRYYSEESLYALPLRSLPDEIKIAAAANAIDANSLFLSSIPCRQKPLIPAYIAAKYTFGTCAVYAEALSAITGLQATSLIALKYTPLFAGSKRGEADYIHSLILNPDGTGEDVWGKQAIETIAARFGIAEFRLDSVEHNNVVTNLKRNSPGRYAEEYAKAEELIKTYRLPV